MAPLLATSTSIVARREGASERASEGGELSAAWIGCQRNEQTELADVEKRTNGRT